MGVYPARQAIIRLMEAEEARRAEVEFVQLRDRLGQLERRLGTAAPSLTEARARGYLYQADLESRLMALKRRWPEVRHGAEAEMERRGSHLRPLLEAASARLAALSSRQDEPLDVLLSDVLRMEDELDRLGRQAADAQDKIIRTFAEFEAEAAALVERVNDCLRILNLRDGATFALESGEGIVDAAKASWLQGPDRECEGILYLSDRRLLYERCETLPERRSLLRKRPAAKVRALAWEVPLVRSAEHSVHALMVRKGLLVLRVDLPDLPGELALRLQADPDAWRRRLTTVVSGEIALERVSSAS